MFPAILAGLAALGKLLATGGMATAHGIGSVGSAIGSGAVAAGAATAKGASALGKALAGGSKLSNMGMMDMLSGIIGGDDSDSMTSSILKGMLGMMSSGPQQQPQVSPMQPPEIPVNQQQQIQPMLMQLPEWNNQNYITPYSNRIATRY